MRPAGVSQGSWPVCCGIPGELVVAAALAAGCSRHRPGFLHPHLLPANVPTMTKAILATIAVLLCACSSGATTTTTTTSGGVMGSSTSAGSSTGSSSSTTAGSSAGITGTGTATIGSGTTASTGTTGRSAGSSSGATGSSTGSSTGGGVMIGTPCDPNAMPDTICAPAGYMCDSTSASCQLPTEFSPCSVTVGCATGLTCTPGFGDAGTDKACAQSCSDSASCINSLTTCDAVVGSTGTKACLLNSGCTGAYLACNAAGSNDGTCYPAMSDSMLYCQQGGPIAANEPCGSTREDGGTTLCEVDSICVGFNTTSSACLSLCALGAPTFPDGGPGCGAYSLCIGFSPGTNWGVCLLGCVTVADCPSPYTQCLALQGLSETFCVP
jgi:hypothetical protein